jgi:hypothetical protein
MNELVSELDYHRLKADPGRWMAWLATHDSGDPVFENKARDLMGTWTREDYKAAGEWLVGLQPGPSRESITLSYLETVAPYDVDAATQWARTLSPEKQPDALRRIHQALLKKDEAAARAFAESHHIADP